MVLFVRRCFPSFLFVLFPPVLITPFPRVHQSAPSDLKHPPRDGMCDTPEYLVRHRASDKPRRNGIGCPLRSFVHPLVSTAGCAGCKSAWRNAFALGLTKQSSGVSRELNWNVTFIWSSEGERRLGGQTMPLPTLDNKYMTAPSCPAACLSASLKLFINYTGSLRYE